MVKLPSIDMSCQPVYLFPEQHLDFSQCKVMPGVTLQRLEGRIKRELARAKQMPGEKGGYNFVVRVAHGEYVEGLKERMVNEGTEPPEDIWVETFSITKHVVLSLVIVARLRFRTGAVHTFEEAKSGSRKVFRRLGGSSPGILQFQEASDVMYSALVRSEQKPSTRRDVLPVVNALERYFRSRLYWNDQLGMALGSFWNSLCTPFPDLAFLGLSASLEALLLTSSSEVTHTLAERAAVLVEKTVDERKTLYQLLKKLYGIRSKIVHGSVGIKRGIQHVDQFSISAKVASVPRAELADMIDLTIRVIIAASLNEDYQSAIRSKNKKDVASNLNDFFLTQLFRR